MLPGEVRAGLPASGRRWQLAGVVAVGERAWAACSCEGPRGRPGGLGGLPRVHLAADAPWTRSTGGVRASGGEAERGEGNRDSFANFKSSGTSQ